MRKILRSSVTFIFCLIFLANLLTGCSRSEKTTWPGEVREDIFLITIENYNLTLFNNLTLDRSLEFYILTVEDVDPSQISIEMDIQTPYEYSFEKLPMDDEIPEYVYMTYSGIDWGEATRLSMNLNEHINSGDIEKQMKALEEIEDYETDFLEGFDSIKHENPYKNLNLYRGFISFEMDKANLNNNEVIETITLTIGDSSEDFTIGRIVLDYTTEFENEFVLESVYLGAWDIPLTPNPNGEIEVNDMEFVATEDLIITDIRILNDNATIKEVAVSTEKDGVAMDRSIDKDEGLFLVAGTKVSPKVIVSDITFKNNLHYSTTIYTEINYKVGGNNYTTYFESNYITKPNMYQLIAVKIDGVDFEPFYFDYYYNLKDDN